MPPYSFSTLVVSALFSCVNLSREQGLCQKDKLLIQCWLDMRADDVQGVGSLMRQGETLHATESLWRATGRRTPARHLPSPVSWQTCGLRVGGAAREANLQSSPWAELVERLIPFRLCGH